MTDKAPEINPETYASGVGLPSGRGSAEYDNMKTMLEVMQSMPPAEPRRVYVMSPQAYSFFETADDGKIEPLPDFGGQSPLLRMSVEQAVIQSLGVTQAIFYASGNDYCPPAPVVDDRPAKETSCSPWMLVVCAAVMALVSLAIL